MVQLKEQFGNAWVSGNAISIPHGTIKSIKRKLF